MCHMRIKKQFLIFVLLVFLFRGLLDYIYISSISKYYSYALFFVHFNWYKYLISYVLMELIVVFIPYRGKRISDLGILIVFLFITIPVISYWALADRVNEYVVITALSTILLALLSKKKIIINHGLVSNQVSKINPIIVPTTTAATSSVPNLKALPINEPLFSLLDRICFCMMPKSDFTIGHHYFHNMQM